MKFEVDERLVKPVIQDQIATAVVAQLGNTKDLVKAMVKLALQTKVDEDGKVNQYPSYNKHDFIEVLAAKAIRAAAKEAIERVVAGQKDEIRKAVEEHLRNAPQKTAEALVNAFCQSAANSYRLNVDFTITPTDY